MDLKERFEKKKLKEYKGKKHFASLYLQKIDTEKFYILYIVERVGETGISFKNPFYKELSLNWPIKKIEKLVKGKIGEFEVMEV